jgi:hypothetical protein
MKYSLFREVTFKHKLFKRYNKKHGEQFFFVGKYFFRNKIVDRKFQTVKFSLSLTITMCDARNECILSDTGKEKEQHGNKTKQNKTRQNKTKQDKTRQDKTRQDKTRQDKTKQDKTRQDKTRQNKTKQDKTNS